MSMDVRNSSGALVSILNDSSESRKFAPHSHFNFRQPHSHSHPQLHASHSSSSSSTSTSTSTSTASLLTLSPTTPALTRRDSSLSLSNDTQSPSPITPLLSFNTQFYSQKYATGLPHPLIVSTSSPYLHTVPSGAMDSSFSQVPQSAMSDMHFNSNDANGTTNGNTNQEQQHFRPGLQMSSFENNGYPTTTAPKAQKKNSYPCPVSKQYGCNEFFTTSGHAARHAKRHTGKKDAICPECSKAFTRKDNMEQHRRTHSGVRAAAKNASSSDESKTKRLKVQHQQKRAETPEIQSASPAVSNNPDINNFNMSSLNSLNNINNTNAINALAAMNNMNNISDLSNNIQSNLGSNAAPVAQMGMDMLDPRLMDGAMFNNDLNILPTSMAFQQGLPSFGGGPRPSSHRSSYQEPAIANTARPPTATTPNDYTSASASKSPTESTSPNSHAPALDALALAASRQ